MLEEEGQEGSPPQLEMYNEEVEISKFIKKLKI
jgi:hypothetical protein